MSDKLYGQGFYNSQLYGSLQSAQIYLNHLFLLWGVPNSVADLGCGRGTWLATCRDLGVKRTVGIDGDWNLQQDMLDPKIEFYPADLEKPISLKDVFDLAISLEVAEHLQPECADTFVESLTKLSDAVLFGAAFTGQPGVNHINTRPHSYWAKKFLDRGYLLFDLFRPTFWNDDRVEPCYRQNTFLYVKPSNSLYRALVNRSISYNRDVGLIDSVHPVIYMGLLNEFIKLQQVLEASPLEHPLQDQQSPVTSIGALSDKSNDIGSLIEGAETQVGLNRFFDAAETYRHALAQDPNNPECLLRLSHLLLRMKCYEESFHHARHFLRIVNDVAFGYYLAGHAAREIGRWQDSRSYLLRAVELDPSHMYNRVLCCMSAFTVCMNQAETDSMVRTYIDELDALISCTTLDTPESIDNAVGGIGALAPFFLPYLGCDVKSMQAKYGAWVCSIMAAKYPKFTHPLLQRSANDKIKIGIVSNYFHNHSNWKIPIKGWLEHLDRELFSIHCFHTGEISDNATVSARSLSDTFLQCSDLEVIATTIREHQIDVLIYPGIGMETATLKLAALRLAPIQCASWGHPVTTGMPTVDYYISSDLMEPANGDEHYTEKLVRLPNLSIWYESAEPKQNALPAFAMPGIEKHDVMFLCSQNLLKYLPRYDFVFPEIARQVSNARFVFIASQVSELTEKFMRRLELAFQDRGLNAADHVLVMPQLGEADFSALNARADIFLDSIEWSGCNTVFESLPFNKPIVTLPGSFMRGRHAYAILKMMGIEEAIVGSVEEYISVAVRLATVRSWRDEVSFKISQNKHKIYQDRACIADMEKFFLNVAGGILGKGTLLHTMRNMESGNAEVWITRGIAFLEEGQYVEAEECFRRADTLAPDSLKTIVNLGYATEMQSRTEDAEALYRRAIKLKPDYIEAHLSLGNLLYSLGRIGEAETAYRLIIRINSEYDKAYYNLGLLLYGIGRLDEAEAAYQQAITRNPKYDKAYCNLGILLSQLRRFDEARAAYCQAITITPHNAELHCNLGDVLLNLGRLDDAVASYHQAITIKPEYADAYNSLGIAVGLLCRLDEAERAFRKAIAHKPDFVTAYSNLLLTLQYIGSYSQEETFVEALKFGQYFEDPFKGIQRKRNNVREPGKRLKVGIVSGNLCDHPVGFFIEAVLQYFDQKSIELYAYANQMENDALGERVKAYFAEWLFVKDMSDENLASRISDDGIDILIDLAGHTAGNRIRLFVYKPSPVQVTWLGYPNTTGLSSIDYILADPITVPANEEKFYSEKIWRLPDTYICFTPPDFNLEINSLPAVENGYITFGYFNNPVKITNEAIACWAEIMRAVPNSKLLLKIRQRLDNAISLCDFFRHRFLMHGIDPARLCFEGAMSSRQELITSYRQVDIALDPFPYNGTTTTCEAAWMGVPTLTVKMPRGIYSYNGELIMRSVGLADWVADSVEGYIETARKMTMDIPQLIKIRAGLREQLLDSPLCDAPKFANNLELALRGMWQQWCLQAHP